MEEHIEVRRLRHVEGLSVRAIARATGFHRSTVQKILASGGPLYRRGAPAARPVLGPFTGVIDAILEADRRARPKQRHTAQRIFDRLREEHGYRGGYTQVRDYVAQARNLRRQAFVPLEFGPGEAQVDWGEAWVVDGIGAERKAHVFVMTLPFSDARFAAAFPRETLEFFLEGHERAFRFFGGVLRRIVYDNLTLAVTKVGRGRRRDRNRQFDGFARRHLFVPAFCNVAQAHEKGHVENGVGWARRNLFVPQPAFSDWATFNASLEERCRAQWPKRLRGHERSIGERLAEERGHLLPIPQGAAPHQAKPQTVSSLCLVRFDTNDYSVPCAYAHHPVTVQADVGRVRIFHQGRCIASHQRCHEREQAVYEPWHYLALIERRPLALDYGAPMKRLELDECFGVLRRRMEDGQEHSEGTRAYIRILRLLERHSLAQLSRAVRRTLELGVEDYEAVKSLLLLPEEKTPSPLDLTGRAHLAGYRISAPDLSVYAAAAGGVQ
jgi:transposase